jgi:hypothetical protein
VAFDHSGLPISSSLAAADFTLSEARTVSAVDVFLYDGVTNGTFDGFGGTLSWAIYSQTSGLPGTIVATGADAAVAIGETDEVDFFGSDLVRARIDLSPPPALEQGTYWLALHEGVWGSEGDGTTIFWHLREPKVGAPVASATDEVGGTGWVAGSPDNDYDLSFVLFESPIFALGFEAGTACAWHAQVAGLCP